MSLNVPRCWLVWLSGLQLLSCGSAIAADRLVLRDLQVIQDRPVERLDDQGVWLSDGTLLTWDQIEQGKLDERQEQFDQYLEQLGTPLFRIRQRLRLRDDISLTRYADPLVQRYRDSRGPTSYLVMVAAMQGRLAEGRRVEALEPYLYALEMRRRTGEQQLTLPGDRSLDVDLSTGLTSDLLPIWFDSEAAARNLPLVGRAIGRMQRPWLPGVRVYYASLAAAASAPQRMRAALRDLPGEAPWKAWRDLVEAPVELLEQSPERLIGRLQPYDSDRQPDEIRALTLYWLGRAELQREGRADIGILHLLKVPAWYGASFPHLSAAALDFARQSLAEQGRVAESGTLRQELLEKFERTYHGHQLAETQDP